MNKKTIVVDMTILRPLIEKMERELTDVLEKYYSLSPYEKWEMSFNIQSHGYVVEAGLLPNPHLNTVYVGDSPINS